MQIQQTSIKGSLHQLPIEMVEKLFGLQKDKRLDYFDEIKELLSDDLYWTVLRALWIDHGTCSERWRNLMFADRKRHHKIMKSSDRQALNKFPKFIKVYRACNSKDLLENCFNWTLSYEVAARFKKERIYSRLINKKEVYAYFNSRKEQEVIIDIRRIGKCEQKKKRNP